MPIYGGTNHTEAELSAEMAQSQCIVSRNWNAQPQAECSHLFMGELACAAVSQDVLTSGGRILCLASQDIRISSELRGWIFETTPPRKPLQMMSRMKIWLLGERDVMIHHSCGLGIESPRMEASGHVSVFKEV